MSADIQSDIAELNLRATRRLGEISARLEKGAGRPKNNSSEQRKNFENTKAAALADIGVSRQRASEAEKIASIPEEIFESVLSSAKTEVSKAEIAEFARLDQAQQKAVEEKLASGKAKTLTEAQRQISQCDLTQSNYT